MTFGVLGFLLLLGWCAGSREIELEALRARPCGCVRCWYVSEPPVTAPLFCANSFMGKLPPSVRKLVPFMAVAGIAFWLIHRVLGKKKARVGS